MNIRRTVIATIVVATSFTPLIAYAVDTDKLKHDIKDAQSELAAATKDAAITAKIKLLFAAESDIPSMKINVKTEKQVVYLQGWVQTVLQANRMIEIAQSVSSVKEVNDSKLKTENSDDFFNDALVTAKVKGKISQLANDLKISKGYELHVETTNGNVHIFGDVINRSDIKEVEYAAKSVLSVVKVSTNIKAIKS